MMTSIPLSSVRTSRAGVLAGRLGLIALLALAIPTRVLNLEAFAGKFDEGIRGTQLMLMAVGFRPFREIFVHHPKVEGMHLRHGEDVLVADTAEQFADAVARVYTDEALWSRLARGGLDNVERHFSPRAAAASLEALLRMADGRLR